MINGVIWWFVGALILMPTCLGMANIAFQIGTPHWLILMGHRNYGIVTVLLFAWLIRNEYCL
jgi:hypothetical protein